MSIVFDFVVPYVFFTRCHSTWSRTQDAPFNNVRVNTYFINVLLKDSESMGYHFFRTISVICTNAEMGCPLPYRALSFIFLPLWPASQRFIFALSQLYVKRIPFFALFVNREVALWPSIHIWFLHDYRQIVFFKKSNLWIIVNRGQIFPIPMILSLAWGFDFSGDDQVFTFYKTIFWTDELRWKRNVLPMILPNKNVECQGIEL